MTHYRCWDHSGMKIDIRAQSSRAAAQAFVDAGWTEDGDMEETEDGYPVIYVAVAEGDRAPVYYLIEVSMRHYRCWNAHAWGTNYREITVRAEGPMEAAMTYVERMPSGPGGRDLERHASGAITMAVAVLSLTALTVAVEKSIYAVVDIGDLEDRLTTYHHVEV